MNRKRRHTRIMFQTKAELTLAGQIITGEVDNLSLKGMLLHTTHKVKTGQKLNLTIFLSSSSSELSLSIKGQVVRLDKNSLAIEFIEMDLDTFIHLRSIIAYNEGDDQKIMEEFYKSF